MANERDRAAVIAPPPLLMVIAIGAGLLANRFRPFALLPRAGASGLVVAAIVLLMARVSSNLSAKCGDAYANYCRHVRRWI